MLRLQGVTRHGPLHDLIAAPIRPRRVLLCCQTGETGQIARRLTDFGLAVDITDEVFTALAEVIDDPSDYSALVLDCESPGIGGLVGGHRAVQMLGAARGRTPVILISIDCRAPCFPLDREAPVELQAPASAPLLRAGLAHVLRDRLPGPRA